MKKLFMLLAVALPCFIFTSCGDDDEGDGIPGSGSTDPGSGDNSGENNDDEEITPIMKSPQCVDLGLSVMWADKNIGANYPEDYGDYFAWGETKTMDEYNWSTYKFSDGSSANLTKYCTDSSYGLNGFADNKVTLDPEDDVATVLWGYKWRMPTYEELVELRTKCTWAWTSLNGVDGFKITGPNGQSIFLPAAGYRDNDLTRAGFYGIYWTASLMAVHPSNSFCLYFKADEVNCDRGVRYYGHSIRPVSNRK